MVDDVLDKSYMRFLLHYNFPPFSTGEAKAQRGVGRREIGHGHLAWRGLKGQIPTDFPYTVRVVSDILESNGSSSMATVCAGTLSLMDAGVPLKAPVSGIAMGLIKNPGEDKYAVLDVNASRKAARFVRFCDAFNIPIVSLVDVPGFLPGTVRNTMP